MQMQKDLTGYPSIDKPWTRYYTKAPIGIPSPETSMYAFLYECNKSNLDYTALNYFGKKISYGKLFENIDAVASALSACGVKKGDIVSLCALTTPEFVYLLYALNKIGAVSNWMGLTSPISDLHGQLLNTGSRIVFTVSLAYEQIREAARDTGVDTIITIPIEYSMPALPKALLSFKNRNANAAGTKWRDFMARAGQATKAVSILPEDMAMIEYTGGSTGVPKGVMLSNRAMNSYYVNCVDLNQSGIIPYRKTEKLLCGVPLFLAFGVSSCCHGPLCHSMELILAPDPSPEAGTKIILNTKVNHIIAGRLLIEELVATAQRKRADLSFIKSIMYGGEETNKAWENSITTMLEPYHVNTPILNGYGMTETSAAILVAPDNDTDGLIPFANVNVKIVDPDDATQEYGYETEGELCLSAETLMNGYYQNEAETDEVIFEENGKRWLKTHDLATISPEGIIKITGRIKRIYSRLTSDRIQVRVYPMRIEESLIKNDLVRECAVVGIKDDVLAYRSIAYIILSDKTTDSNEAKSRLESWCKSTLPDSHWPDEYIFTEAFPITRAGKVDYRALEEMAKNL